MHMEYRHRSLSIELDRLGVAPGSTHLVNYVADKCTGTKLLNSGRLWKKSSVAPLVGIIVPRTPLASF